MMLAKARAALRRNDLQEAERALILAAQSGEASPDFFNLLGILHQCRGRDSLARKFFGRAIAADSGYAPAQQNMRRMYELATLGVAREAVALGDEFQLEHESCARADQRRCAHG